MALVLGETASLSVKVAPLPPEVGLKIISIVSKDGRVFARTVMVAWPAKPVETPAAA